MKENSGSKNFKEEFDVPALISHGQIIINRGVNLIKIIY